MKMIELIKLKKLKYLESNSNGTCGEWQIGCLKEIGKHKTKNVF